MKKFLTVLCLALLLTLVCASALAAGLDPKYKSNNMTINDLTKINGKDVELSPKDMKILVEPKCQTGTATVRMTDGTYETLSVDALHTLELQTLDGKKATCEQNGVGHYVCKDCGRVDPYGQGDIAIAATGHKYQDEKFVIDVKTTCTQNGKTHRVCVNCGEPEKDPLTKQIIYTYHDCTIEHAFVPGPYHIEKEQTCKEGGKRYLTCADCGEPELNTPHNPSSGIKYDATYEVPAEHTFGAYVVTVPATCKPGLKTRYCSVCNFKESVEIPGTDAHQYEENLVPNLPCTATGGVPDPATFSVAKRVCKICGYEDPAYVAPTNYLKHHSFTADPEGVNTPAGCVGSGLYGTKALVCTSCGGKLVENIPPATSHSWGAWELKVKPGADGTKNGVWERKCTNYKCVQTETYVGTTAPSGAAPVPSVTEKPSTTPTTSGSEKYQFTSWGFSGSSVSGSVAGNVSYRTPGLSVNVIIYTPTGTFLSVNAPVDEDGHFSVSAGGAVYAVSVQLKDNTKTYQTEGKYV